MQKDPSIDANNVLAPFEDYHYLRAQGIRLIESLSGKVWTDYNTNDPGITLLEALCYALTDLGYRTSFDIKDILTAESKDADWSNYFLTAKQVLSSGPVTLTDYRKLVIDTEGVKNAWVEPSDDYEVLLYLNTEVPSSGTEPVIYKLGYSEITGGHLLAVKGLYKIVVEYDEDIFTGNQQEDVNKIIRSKLNIHRNLGEDFLSINPVDYELFTMQADVQVSEGFDIEKINAAIFLVIHNFFSPSVKFYTLKQMFEKGYTAEEIFDGPSLKNGFIDTSELENSEKYMDIHLSDIIKLIIDIPGVIAIKKCVFPIETQSAFSDFTRWITKVKEKEKIPKLNIDNSTINFIRSGDRHRSDADKMPDKKRVKAIWSFLQSEQSPAKLQGTVNDIHIPAGEYMDIADYYPFQLSLPPCYGMQETIFKLNAAKKDIENTGQNDTGQQAGASAVVAVTTESAQAKEMDENLQIKKLQTSQKQILQLRGFLMIFEQIMADYLSQLANVRQLFSPNLSVAQTYFPQPLKDIHDLEYLFINFDTYKHDLHKLAETDSQFFHRRNTMLNHLLARLGEDAEAYMANNTHLDPNTRQNIIQNKSDILNDYIPISSYRGVGYNYSNADKYWDTDNIAGMKHRICRLLGIKHYKTTFITSDQISHEKVAKPGNAERTKIVVRDAGKNAAVLLESNEYDSVSETNEALKYILESGLDKTRYDIDTRRNKYTYRLKRNNSEGDVEFIAGNTAAGAQELEDNFKKTIALLQTFAQAENFHLVEHILLRPRINPQEVLKRDTGKAEAVELLSVINVPLTGITTDSKSAATPYHFKTTAASNPDQPDKIIWKLSLKKGKEDIIIANDDFIFKSYILKRVTHLRRIATDNTHYLREKNADNRSFFSITDGQKYWLSASEAISGMKRWKMRLNNWYNTFPTI